MNVEVMKEILLNYAVHNPKIGYTQVSTLSVSSFNDPSRSKNPRIADRFRTNFLNDFRKFKIHTRDVPHVRR